MAVATTLPAGLFGGTARPPTEAESVIRGIARLTNLGYAARTVAVPGDGPVALGIRTRLAGMGARIGQLGQLVPAELELLILVETADFPRAFAPRGGRPLTVADANGAAADVAVLGRIRPGIDAAVAPPELAIVRLTAGARE